MFSWAIARSLIRTSDSLDTSAFEESIQFLHGKDFFSIFLELHFKQCAEFFEISFHSLHIDTV